MVSSLVIQLTSILNNIFMKNLTIIILLYLIPCTINSQILFSEYVEGSAYNKYIEIYNYSTEIVDLTNFVLTSCTNGCVDGTNFYINQFPEGAAINPGDVYVVSSSQAEDDILLEADYSFQYCCGNGDDVYALMLNCCVGDVWDDLNAIDIVGAKSTWQEGIGWDVSGVEEATENHTLIRKSSVSSGNAGLWANSAGTNDIDSEWIVLEQDDFSNIGFHQYDSEGGSDIFGCTCLDADNYNPIANIDNGSCVISGICIDPLAINFTEPACQLLDVEYLNQDCQYIQSDTSGCLDLNSCNYFDFDYNITASNMSIVITSISDNIIDGDIIGGFFIDPLGYLHCAGSTEYQQGSGDVFNLAISIWGDDPFTIQQDGLEFGDPLFFLILRDEEVFETTAFLTNEFPFIDVYADNGFGQMDLTLGEQFVENCVYPNEGYDCSGNINSTTILDLTHGREIIEIKDLLGRTSELSNVGIKIIKYSDGSIDKVYFLNH